MTGETVRIHVVLPRELVEAIDEFVGQRKRSAFIAEAIAAKVSRERFGKALAETAGILADVDHPEWDTPEKTSTWVRALRSVDNAAMNRKLSHTPPLEHEE